MSKPLRSPGFLVSAIRQAARPGTDCSMGRAIGNDIVCSDPDALGRTWDIVRCRARSCQASCGADPVIEALRLEFGVSMN